MNTSTTVDLQIEEVSERRRDLDRDQTLRGTIALDAIGGRDHGLEPALTRLEAQPDIKEGCEANGHRARAPEMEDGSEALTLRIYDEIINQGNVALASEVVTADFVDHIPYLFSGQSTRGPAALA